MKRCFQVDATDNVSTMLDDAENEPVQVLGAGRKASLAIIGAVTMGHKVALRDLSAGTSIVKFGVPIGVATRDIRKGEWVHLQNCHSRLDVRSSSLDPHSGATTDTVYE
jgi:altronate hydrolase/altronate dehydratase small subunit